MSVAAFPQEALNWLGRLPAGWQVKPLKHVVRVNPEALSDSTDPDWRMTYADISSVSLGQGIVDTEEFSFEDAPSRARRLVRPGDTLVSTVRTYLRAITVVREPPENLVASTGFAVLRPSSTIDANFLGYFATSDAFVNAVVAQSVGVSYPATNASDIVRLPIAFPRIEQQQKIATFLDRKTAEIDTLIARKRRLRDRLAEKRTALITRAVTKGLDPDAPMKDSGIEWLGEIPAHWRASRVKFFAAVGNGSTPSRENADYWVGGDYPWLNSGVVNKGSATEADQFVTELALRECHLPIIDPPAILLGITGQGKTRGMTTKLEIQATINQHLVFVKPDERVIDIDYLYAIFERAYLYLRSESDGGGSTKGAITCSQVENLCVPLPPVTEQREIALALQESQAKLHGVSRKIGKAIERLEEYRSALITNAVTGQIKVA